MKSFPAALRSLLACVALSGLFAIFRCFAVAAEPLQVSVYCTAGEVQRYLLAPGGPDRVFRAIQPLGVTRLFLEGRRGDEYVAPVHLGELRDVLQAKGLHCSGGIATVPGKKFGTRQNAGLEWLNWESPATRASVAEFFQETAPIFDELIIDDFFCTGDISSEAEKAKGARSWGEYRRDLLVSLIDPLVVKPTRAVHRQTRLIMKFPQWYDRFQLFGYDPPRMSAHFDQVWVGTEVRDPNTRRMGFVQPTEGYSNFRWLASVAGAKVRGAWFDHIECSAQNFLDQAYQSVLAGAGELTLFSLGDLMEGHPGDALLASRLPELKALAARVRGNPRIGIAYYKPPGSDGEENMYLADYLGMIGLPVLPQAQYPEHAAVVFLPVQAAADADLVSRMERQLRRGATLVLTPALARMLGVKGGKLAGIETGPRSSPALADEFRIMPTAQSQHGGSIRFDSPLEVDAAVAAAGCEVRVTALAGGRETPLLTRMSVGRGQVLVLNVRTFSETDFHAGERLLAPLQLGLPKIPRPLADTIRSDLLGPLGVDFRAPAGIELVLFKKERCLYNFRNEQTRVEFGGKSFNLPANQLLWIR